MARPGRLRSRDDWGQRSGRFGLNSIHAPTPDAYLKLNPEDGRAYRERSGTNSRLKRTEAALADSWKACELKDKLGCTMHKAFSRKMAGTKR